MKHILTSAILVAACAVGASAQSVVIVDKESLPHKFAANRIENITFIKVDNPVPDKVVFSSIEVSPYNGGYADIVLKTDDGTKLTMYVCGPKTTTYLETGVYNVEASNNPMTVDTDPAYSYLDRDGRTLHLVSGTMTVSRTEAEYTITTDFKLDDGTKFESEYIGKIPNYSPIMTLNDASAAKVTEINDRQPGEFYVKLNDTNYSYEMVLDFFASSDATTLPAGTYTYAEQPDAGNLGPKSGIELYNPYSHSRFVDGTAVTVTYEGEEAVISMNLKFSDGREANCTFKGKITY